MDEKVTGVWWEEETMCVELGSGEVKRYNGIEVKEISVMNFGRDLRFCMFVGTDGGVSE